VSPTRRYREWISSAISKPNTDHAHAISSQKTGDRPGMWRRLIFISEGWKSIRLSQRDKVQRNGVKVNWNVAAGESTAG
jgi:hypothetical protein